MTLTPRESAIIAALAAGKTLKEIAGELGMAYTSLHKVMRLTCRRHGYKTMTQMVVELNIERNKPSQPRGEDCTKH